MPTAWLSLPEPILLWAGGGVSLLTVLVLTPIVIRLARPLGWIDRPSDNRWHNRPTALVGGIAIFASIAAGGAVSGGELYPWPVWAGAGLLFATGLVDDLRGVRPEVKLLAQVAATTAVLYAGYAFWRGGPTWVSLPLTFLWVIGITNAFNLIDGIDGLAAGVAAAAAGGFAFAGFVLGRPSLAGAMLVLVGAALGFLAYNAPKASIFMGDCGSLVLGYLLAVGALVVQVKGGPVAGTLVPVAVLAVPIFDTSFVTVTRLLRGESVTDGGVDHVHHRLVQRGASEERALIMLCGASLACGALALATLWMPPLLSLAVLGGCALAAMAAGIYLQVTGGKRGWGGASSSRGPETS